MPKTRLPLKSVAHFNCGQHSHKGHSNNTKKCHVLFECLRYNPNSINCHQTKLWIKRTLISVTFGRPVFFAINENQIWFFSLYSLLVFKSIKCEYFFLQISAISIPRKLILQKAVVSAYWSRIFIRIIKCWLWRFWTLNTYTAPLLTSDKVFVRYLSLLKSTVLLVFWPTLERQ